MKTPPKITGTRLVNEVVKYKRNQANHMVLPNVFVYDWESDIFFVDQDQQITEYEVKVSVSDYHADFSKVAKHDCFKNMEGKIPNYFYYVVPEGMIHSEDVPDYAGLIYWVGPGWFKVIKTAPLLHDLKIGSGMWEEIAMKLYYKTL